MAVPGGITFGAPLAPGSQPYAPITFGAPLLRLTQPVEAAPAGLAASAEMPIMVPQYVGGYEAMADGRDVGAPGGMSGSAGGMATQFDNSQIANTPFGPITPADIAGFLANLVTPSPAQLLSYAATGRTVGGNVKASLTPVSEASIAMSPAAFDLAQQIGITPAEAQGMINAMGGSNAVAGQDLGAMAAQSLGLDTGMGASYGAVGGDGGGGYGGYGGDTGGADTGGFGGEY